MQLEHRPDHWEHIKPMCLPEVQAAGYSEYFVRVQDGVQRAKGFLREACNPFPGPDALKAVHALLFQEVYPFAGEFLSEEQAKKREVPILRPDFPQHPAYPTRIRGELEKLCYQAESLYSAAKDDNHNSVRAKQAITYSHAQLKRIHPFCGGNTRLALLLTDFQLEATFNRKLDVPSMAQHRAGELQAFKQQDLRLLGMALTGMDLAEYSKAPHPVGLEEPVVVPPLRFPDNETAYALAHLPRTTRDGKYINLPSIPKELLDALSRVQEFTDKELQKAEALAREQLGEDPQRTRDAAEQARTDALIRDRTRDRGR